MVPTFVAHQKYLVFVCIVFFPGELLPFEVGIFSIFFFVSLKSISKRCILFSTF